MEEIVRYDGHTISTKSRPGRTLSNRGEAGSFRSPEPNGEAAPAIVGIFHSTSESLQYCHHSKKTALTQGKSSVSNDLRTNPTNNATSALPQKPRVESINLALRFEYTGHTALTVRGPIIGRNYRFNVTGEQITVNGRDASAFMAVPKLRLVL